MHAVLTIDQLAEYLQIPKSTLYKLVQDGKVPGKKVGRQWRFHREAVDAWLVQGPDLSEGDGSLGEKQEGKR
jgi:excisionase family DNA binding protein